MECLIYRHVKKSPIENKQIQRVVLQTLRRVKRADDVSVHLIGDTRMKRLNTIYRSKEKTTDVLSFSAREGFQISGEQTEAGDIFISIPQIIRQAKKYEVTSKEEMIRMLVHGVLHLVGYDHMREVDAKKMFRIQEEMVRNFVTTHLLYS
ncbi:MAG: rRNA maturation RNase YbeY [Candidatus Magasanikbacteria bacterium]|nr:rRNA maturation RNase YbeY [Candidatus Magasanikbacteria bacterium]